MRKNCSLFAVLLSVFVFTYAQNIINSNTDALPLPWGTPLGYFWRVRAFANGNINNYYNDIYGGRYQCVEYIMRFYVWAVVHKNMRDAFPRPQHAKYFYDRYQELELNRYPNNGTVAPQVGDIICSNGNITPGALDTFGHVAIVRRVESNGIYVIQQNWYQDYRDTAMFLSMTTSGGRYNVSGFSASYPVQGWLRKPQHTLNDIRYVDDNSSAFMRFGPAQYWYEVTFNSTSTSSPIGIGREHMWFTYSNGNTVSNYAIWQPTLYPLPQNGRYEVFAFIPAVNATTVNARYEIYYYGGSTTRTVNQSNYKGVWVSLGTYPFLAGSSGYVKLTDATGEPVGAKKIGFDEIAWVYRGALGVEEDDFSQTVNQVQDNNLMFEVYPNPTSSVIYIRVLKSVNRSLQDALPYTLKLYDVSGKMVKLKEFKVAENDELRISIDGLKPGIYFLQLNNETINKKLVVTKRYK